MKYNFIKFKKLDNYNTTVELYLEYKFDSKIILVLGYCLDFLTYKLI